MSQTWEDRKKPNFGWEFGVFGQNWGLQCFLLWVSFLLSSYYQVQFTVKLMSVTWENGKTTNFRPAFGIFPPNLPPKIFSESSASTSCKTLFQVCSKLCSYAI